MPPPIFYKCQTTTAVAVQKKHNSFHTLGDFAQKKVFKNFADIRNLCNFATQTEKLKENQQKRQFPDTKRVSWKETKNSLKESIYFLYFLNIKYLHK